MSTESDVRERLHTQQAELENRLNGIRQDFARTRSADSQDRAGETENDDTLNALQTEAEYELQQVKTALEKLEAGRYNTCSACEQTIEADRLEAVPAAILCLKCAKGAENAH